MGKRIESWEVSDEFWQRVEPLVPLRVRAALDDNTYEAGIKVSDEQLDAVRIERDEFHGEWNYRIRPRTSRHRKIPS